MHQTRPGEINQRCELLPETTVQVIECIYCGGDWKETLHSVFSKLATSPSTTKRLISPTVTNTVLHVLVSPILKSLLQSIAQDTRL